MESSHSFFFGSDLRRLPQEPDQADLYIGRVEDWPAHITVFPPVRTSDSGLIDSVATEVRRAMTEIQPFTVLPVGEALFGEERDRRVTLVNKMRLAHYAIMGIVFDHGLDFPNQFTGRNYSPHTSHIGNVVPINKNQAQKIDSISLFYKSPAGHKSITERFHLGGLED